MRTSPEASSFDRYREQALDVLTSTSAWNALSIENESPKTLERYGDNKFGRSCLVARRLIEVGVRGGQVWGGTDRNGAKPARDPVHVGDFISPVYHALGVSSDTFVEDFEGRPHTVYDGKPLVGLF